MGITVQETVQMYDGTGSGVSAPLSVSHIILYSIHGVVIHIALHKSGNGKAE